MSLSDIDALNINELYRRNFDYSEINECPMCHFAVQPRLIHTCYVDDHHDSNECNLYITFFCPKCGGVFLAKYREISIPSIGAYSYSGDFSLTPVSPNYDKFSSQIKQLSPTFIQTYEQSQYAEALNLTEICGIGYRKSVEYLVKDYLCHTYPDQEEAIKAEPLGKSIKRIDSIKIKTLAERATWIGNDETHYVRKHEDLDTNVMKRFITAMVRYIDSELAFEEADSIEPV